MKQITKQEFEKLIFKALKDEFGFKFYFDDEMPPKSALLPPEANGVSYRAYRPGRVDCIVIIRWEKDYIETLKTLFHEITHMELFLMQESLPSVLKEVEAELVAYMVLEELGAYYLGIKSYLSEFLMLYSELYYRYEKNEPLSDDTCLLWQVKHSDILWQNIEGRQPPTIEILREVAHRISRAAGALLRPTIKAWRCRFQCQQSTADYRQLVLFD